MYVGWGRGVGARGGWQIPDTTKSFRNVNSEVSTGYPGGNPANDWIYRSGDQQKVWVEL